MKFATSNPHKFAEAQKILGNILEQINIDVDELQSVDVIDVVKHKAKVAYEKIKEPVFVEDTGLYIEAWNGLPGALIKRFMKTVGKDGILQMMKNFENRKARAICCIGYFDGKDGIVATGTINGFIATKILGESNFDRDPIFIPEGYEKSFAQMSIEEKNIISHRGKALKEFKKLIDNGGLPLYG